jgi:hypothetical protein
VGILKKKLQALPFLIGLGGGHGLPQCGSHCRSPPWPLYTQLLWQNNIASAQVGGTGTGGEQGCVGEALPATTAGSGEFGLERTGRVLVDQVQ